jgi:hypothetical protein
MFFLQLAPVQISGVYGVWGGPTDATVIAAFPPTEGLTARIPVPATPALFGVALHAQVAELAKASTSLSAIAVGVTR